MWRGKRCDTACACQPGRRPGNNDFRGWAYNAENQIAAFSFHAQTFKHSTQALNTPCPVAKSLTAASHCAAYPRACAPPLPSCAANNVCEFILRLKRIDKRNLHFTSKSPSASSVISAALLNDEPLCCAVAKRFFSKTFSSCTVICSSTGNNWDLTPIFASFCRRRIFGLAAIAQMPWDVSLNELTINVLRPT
jgi:hypothetical protein